MSIPSWFSFYVLSPFFLSSASRFIFFVIFTVRFYHHLSWIDFVWHFTLRVLALSLFWMTSQFKNVFHHIIQCILIYMFFSYSHLPSYMFLFEQLSKNTPSFSLVFYLFSVRVLFLFYRLTPSIPLPLILFLSSFSWWCQFHRISPLFHRFISSFIFSHTTQT